MQPGYERESIENCLQAMREYRGLTQEELARRAVHISLRYIQKIEAGEALPSIYMALLLEEALDIPLIEIFPLENWEGHLAGKIKKEFQYCP